MHSALVSCLAVRPLPQFVLVHPRPAVEQGSWQEGLVAPDALMDGASASPVH